MEIEQGFRERRNLPHALGTIDEKHIHIRCFRLEPFNYKGFHSMVLLAVVDADYKFIWFDIAALVLSSDNQIFLYSNLRQNIKDNTFGFPQAESLVDHGPQVEYFIIKDNPSEPG